MKSPFTVQICLIFLLCQFCSIYFKYMFISVNIYIYMHTHKYNCFFLMNALLKICNVSLCYWNIFSQILLCVILIEQLQFSYHYSLGFAFFSIFLFTCFFVSLLKFALLINSPVVYSFISLDSLIFFLNFQAFFPH